MLHVSPWGTAIGVRHRVGVFAKARADFEAHLVETNGEDRG
jgi:hypothetical protein